MVRLPVGVTTSSWLQLYSRKVEMFLASRARVLEMSLISNLTFLRGGNGQRTILTGSDLDSLLSESEMEVGGAYRAGGGGGGGEGEEDHPQLTMFDLVMGLWIPGAICLFGIVGNLLCLWVLSRRHASVQGRSTFTSLRALAVSDVVVLVGAVLQQILPMLCEHLQRRDAFCLRCAGYVRVYSWPVVCIGQMTSIWTTVLVSAERYVAICHGSRLPPSCSYGGRNWRVLLSISAIWLVSSLFNVPRFFEFVAGEELLDVGGGDAGEWEGGHVTKIVLNATSIRTNGVYRLDD